MSAQPDRAQVLAGIPTYVEMSGRAARHVHESLPLISDLVDIVMDYFEGMWSDEIMHIWDMAHRNPRGHHTWYDTVDSFATAADGRMHGHDKSKDEMFHESISYLETQFDFADCDPKWMVAIENYLISISNIRIYRDPTITRDMVISATMLNAIYILIYVYMRSKSDVFDAADLPPVWGHATSMFVPYKRLYWIKEIDPFRNPEYKNLIWVYWWAVVYT